MNHTLLLQLPHISTEYNRSRYLDRLLKTSGRSEVGKILNHAVNNKNLDTKDLMYIYGKMDTITNDELIPQVDWVMAYLGPVLTTPRQPYRSDLCAYSQTIQL